MDVGMAVVFQATDHGDRDVYQNELRLGDLAEPLGFDSLWSVEHHFTDYTMCPDVLQFLTYFAGRTKTIQLGSMVVVLPWHQPIRAAEQISVLDHMSNGRLLLGIGRGLGRVEFEGFGLDQGESRERFVEAAQTVLGALESGVAEFDGRIVKQARREIRPRPFKSFKGRTYAAAMSPESSEIMARLGVGLLIIPQKPWDLVAQEMANYNRIFREVNKAEPPAHVLAGWVFCDEDEGRARDMAYKYIGGYWKTAAKHYEFIGNHFEGIKGYEAYTEMQKQLAKPGGLEEAIEFFLTLQIWGTPDQCYERITDFAGRIGADKFNGVFSYAGMPYDEAERNLRLFADKVMPRLKAARVGETRVAAE